MPDRRTPYGRYRGQTHRDKDDLAGFLDELPEQLLVIAGIAVEQLVPDKRKSPPPKAANGHSIGLEARPRKHPITMGATYTIAYVTCGAWYGAVKCEQSSKNDVGVNCSTW